MKESSGFGKHVDSSCVDNDCHCSTKKQQNEQQSVIMSVEECEPYCCDPDRHLASYSATQDRMIVTALFGLVTAKAGYVRTSAPKGHCMT